VITATNPPLTFSENGPFHPLVIAYLAQAHGLIELASRGLLAHTENIGEDNVRHWIRNEAGPRERSALERVVGATATPLIEDLTLASQVNGAITVNSDELGRQIFWKHRDPLRRFNTATAGGLLVLAWESTTGNHSREPLWEFMRHCRNAAAHRGHFTFKHGEPRRSAAWRTLDIGRDLEGSALFPDPPNPGFMAVGDVLHLLNDVESAFFSAAV
jgi:hypothetical protein